MRRKIMHAHCHLSRWLLAGAVCMPLMAAASNGELLYPGDATAHLFAAQASGALASSNPQASTPVQREMAADRFLKTYNYPIREIYFGTTFKAGATGGK